MLRSGHVLHMNGILLRGAQQVFDDHAVCCFAYKPIRAYDVAEGSVLR